MICCCAGHKHGLGREGFRPKGSAKEPPAPGPNRPVARGTGSIKASAAPGRQRQHVPARPDVCLRGESERSNHSHTAGQPFLLPAPNPVRSRLPLDRPPPESTRGRWACSCCGRRHARKRTSIRVLISRPSPPVPKNSIPPFLLATTSSLAPFPSIDPGWVRALVSLVSPGSWRSSRFVGRWPD